MTLPVSLLPSLTGSALPPPIVDELTPAEQAMVTGLSSKMVVQSNYAKINEMYYAGTQRLANLGISVPQQLAGIRTVVDWPRICVDPLVQRCVVDGFRLPGATDVDDEMFGHWQANNMDAEAPLAFLDAMVDGRGYMIVGSPDTASDPPAVITVESPLNMAMTWEPRTRLPIAALQSYEVEGTYRAALYLPDESIYMVRDSQSGTWRIERRDRHGFGEVPVERFPNRSRTADREGTSEITAAVKNTTDSAVRSLLGMEIAREFYSIPHRYILGANEEDFVGADGQPKTALDMSMNKFLALERNENGDLPQIGQFQAFDPSVFTKIIDKHAQLMASYTQFPPDWFGQVSQSNPASADAIRSAQDGVNRRAKQVQNQFSDPLERVMRLAWRVANNGAEVPAEFRRMETDWVDAATPTPAGTTDAVTKQIAAGMIPATSDVTLRQVGYSAVERARLDADRKVDAGASILAELANSLQAKEARTDLSVARDINPAAVKAQPGDSTGSHPAQ